MPPRSRTRWAHRARSPGAPGSWQPIPEFSTGNSVGAFALGDAASRDAVLLVTQPPWSYTAQVSGNNNGTGVALVEVYDVP